MLVGIVVARLRRLALDLSLLTSHAHRSRVYESHGRHLDNTGCSRSTRTMHHWMMVVHGHHVMRLRLRSRKLVHDHLLLLLLLLVLRAASEAISWMSC